MEQGIAQFYVTGFWTMVGILITGVGMLFVFYRWVSSFAEKIGNRIDAVEKAHGEKLAELERAHAKRVAALELEQTERINRLERNVVSKEECAVASVERAKPLLIEIAHLKKGQEDLIAKVDKLVEKMETILRHVNGSKKGSEK